jgi:hypothetical protein
MIRKDQPSVPITFEPYYLYESVTNRVVKSHEESIEDLIDGNSRVIAPVS